MYKVEGALSDGYLETRFEFKITIMEIPLKIETFNSSTNLTIGISSNKTSTKKSPNSRQGKLNETYSDKVIAKIKIKKVT